MSTHFQFCGNGYVGDHTKDYTHLIEVDLFCEEMSDFNKALAELPGHSKVRESGGETVSSPIFFAADYISGNVKITVYSPNHGDIAGNWRISKDGKRVVKAKASEVIDWPHKAKAADVPLIIGGAAD